MRLPDAAGYRVDHLALGTLTFDPGVLLPDEGVTVPVDGAAAARQRHDGADRRRLRHLRPRPARHGAARHGAGRARRLRRRRRHAVLTHMDGDHAGGALRGTWPDDVRAAFKRVVILDEALDWWRARTDPNLGRGLVAALERDGVLEPVASGHEFAPHLRLESAPGHRPGHAAVWIGDGFVHGADILHVVEHVANPAWDYVLRHRRRARPADAAGVDRPADRNRDAGALRAHRRTWPDRCRPRVAARAMSLVLGVDGGNTKTVALVAQADGTVVGAGRAGCADIYGAVSPEAAIDAVAGAAQSALEAAAARPAPTSPRRSSAWPAPTGRRTSSCTVAS